MLEAKQFRRTGTTIQVGGFNTVDAKVVGVNGVVQFDANNDRIVEIQDYSGSVVWFAIKATNNITNPSATNGNACIPPYGITRPFILKAGQYIKASGTVNIRALDTQEV